MDPSGLEVPSADLHDLTTGEGGGKLPILRVLTFARALHNNLCIEVPRAPARGDVAVAAGFGRLARLGGKGPAAIGTRLERRWSSGFKDPRFAGGGVLVEATSRRFADRAILSGGTPRH
jgi:hypothetical protein